MKTIQSCLHWLFLALMFAAIMYDAGSLTDPPHYTRITKAWSDR